MTDPLDRQPNSTPPLEVGGGKLKNVEELAHTGIYSTVWKGEISGAAGVDSEVIIKRHHIDPTTIDEEIIEWQRYREIIDSFTEITGISTPHSLGHEVKGNEVYFVDELAGSVDISKLLNSDEIDAEEKEKVIAALFDSLSRIPRDESNQTAYMIDGKFSNFCLKTDGTFSYVDTFPAHRRQSEDGTLLHPSEDHEKNVRSIYTDSFVTGDMYGILGRFFGTLRKDHAELWERIPVNEYMQTVLQKLPSDLKDYCNYMIESDTEFIQGVYKYGASDPSDKRLYDILNP